MSETPIRHLLKRGHDRLLVLFFLRTYFEKRRKTKLLSSIAQNTLYFTALVPTMKVNVYIMITKHGPMSFEIDVGENYTIEDVKREIHTKLDVPPERQRIICSGKQLEDGRTVGDYWITDGSNLRVIIELSRRKNGE